MENPGSWNLLTGSLAACDLAQGDQAWAFLVKYGLVRNAPGDKETFLNLVKKEVDRGPITGPSLALRIANALKDAGIALPSGDVPDPWGKVAEKRFKAMSSGKSDGGMSPPSGRGRRAE